MVCNQFLEKNFTGGPAKAPKMFKNPYFQIVIFETQIKKSINNIIYKIIL